MNRRQGQNLRQVFFIGIVFICCIGVCLVRG
jgi:hypothetical protein